MAHICISPEPPHGRSDECSARSSLAIEFEGVRRNFRDRLDLPSSEAAGIGSTSLEDLQAAIKQIQDSQNQSRRLRYMKRLEPFIRAMEEYSKVIEVFVNTQDMIAFVWGPMKLILQIASTYVDALNTILDTYQQIGESMPQFLRYREIIKEKPFMLDILAMIYHDLSEFHLQALKHLRTKVWKQLFHATWRGFNVKIERIREDLRRHRKLLDSEATIVQLEEMRALREKIEKEAIDREENQRKVNLQTLIHWLSPYDSSIIQESCTNIRTKYPGAGTWLTTNPLFKKWIDPDFCSAPLLWLSGKPGAGKTILASLVVEEAQKLHKSSVAYFYCRHDTGRNKFSDILTSLLSQVSSQNPTTLLPQLFDMMTSSGQTTLSRQGLAKHMLEIALNAEDRTYIILDGLDECHRDERKETVRFFRHLVETRPIAYSDQIRCLFVCQDDGVARKDFSGIMSIEVTPQENERDMKSFAQVWENKIQKKFGSLPQDTEHIGELVTRRAQGMFLFAKLVLQNLYDQTSRASLLKELRPEAFPQRLGDIYERILQRIFDPSVVSQHNDAQKLLGWLACAKRSLKWHEIQGAIATDLAGQTVDFEGRKLLVDAKWLCGSLVEIQHDNTVCFVHQTARRYLVISGRVEPAKVECELTMLCLQYLNLELADNSNTPTDTERMVKDGHYAFLEYAVFSWALHLESILSKPEDVHDQIEDITDALDGFLDIHYEQPKKKRAVSRKIEESLMPFKSTPLYEKLAQAIAEWKNRLGPNGNGSSLDEGMDLPKIASRFHDALEVLWDQPELRSRLEEYYGTCWFRCPHVNCRYFHHGFHRRPDRDKHVARHERAFLCSYHDCVMANLGFVSQKDREQHMLHEHGIDTACDEEFPDPPKSPTKQTGEFGCELCEKRFTRKHNLKSHMRTHTNEKPFKCAKCSKTFGRGSDCIRHEEGHSGEKRFECGGLLKDGITKWGCGMKFARADKLLQHLNSESGRRCQKPLRDEERRDREAQQQFANIQQYGDAQSALPAFPSLAPNDFQFSWGV